MDHDVVARARQVHLARRRIDHVGVELLAARAQRREQIAHLLDAREPEVEILDLDQQAGDGVVGGQRAQLHGQRQEIAIGVDLGQVDALDVARIGERPVAIAADAQEDAAAPGIAAGGVGAQPADRAAAAQVIEVEPEPRGHAVVGGARQRVVVRAGDALDLGEGAQPVAQARRQPKARRDRAPGPPLDVNRGGADLEDVGTGGADRQLTGPRAPKAARLVEVLRHHAERDPAREPPARAGVERVGAAVGRSEDVRPADAEAERSPHAQRVGELELGAAVQHRRRALPDGLEPDAEVVARPELRSEQEADAAARQRGVARRGIAHEDQAGVVELAELAGIQLEGGRVGVAGDGAPGDEDAAGG